MADCAGLVVYTDDPFSYRVMLYTSFDRLRPTQSTPKDLTGITIEAWVEDFNGVAIAQLDVTVLDQSITEQKGAFLISTADITGWPMSTLYIYFRQIVGSVRLPRTRQPISVTVRK